MKKNEVQTRNFFWDGKFRLTEEQIDKLKLLETSEIFQSAIADFRKKFLIDTSRGHFDYPKLGISILELASQVDNELLALGNKLKLPYPLMRSQVLIYIKYNMWAFDPSFPEKYYEPSMGAPSKWFVRNEPVAEIKNGKVTKYSETVSLITYARLSTKEMNEAIGHLKAVQERYLDPKLTKPSRRKRNIERDLNIEKEMDTRQPQRIKETYDGYLGHAKHQLDKGGMTDKKFRELKKIFPADVKRVKTGKTSKEVAQEVLGSAKSAPTARKANARLKKRRGKLFG